MKRLVLLRQEAGLYEDGELILSGRKSKLWDLFKLLFDQRFRKWPRDNLIEYLWPAEEPQLKANALRKNISNLNKLLRPELEIRCENKVCCMVENESIDSDVTDFFRVVKPLIAVYLRSGDVKVSKQEIKDIKKSINHALDLISDASPLKDFPKTAAQFFKVLHDFVFTIKQICRSEEVKSELQEELERIENLCLCLQRVPWGVDTIEGLLKATMDMLQVLLGKKIISKAGFVEYFCISRMDVLSTECIIVESNVKVGWAMEDCTFTLVDPKIKMDPKIQTILKQHIERIWNKSLRKGKSLTNKESYGLYDYTFRQNSYKLHFKFRLTTYKEFVGTNLGLDVPLPQKIEGKYATLREYIKSLYHEDCPHSNSFLRSCLLSNRLGTSTAVITNDGYLVLTRGGDSKQVMPRKYMASIAEGMVHNWHYKDTYEHDRHNPFNTILRGAKQELHLNEEEIEIKPEDIRILAFGFYCAYMQPFIWAYAEVPCSSKTIIKRCRDRLERSKGYDVDKVFVIPFEPEVVADYLVELEKWSPPQALCIYLALCHKYPRGEVDRHIRWAYRRKLHS